MSEPQHRLFERFACAVILGLPTEWTLEFESPDELRCKTSTMRVLLLRWKPENAASFSAALKPQLKALAALDILDVVLLGGGDEAKRALQKSAPLFTTHKVLLHHVGETGTWRSARALGSVVGAAFDLANEGRLPEIDATTASAVEAALTSRRAALVADVNEVNAFATTMKARTPWATYTLLSVIAVVFAAEWILGGDTANAYLMRFGALYAPRVREGELWRLLSCSFLHAGPLHFLLNSYVLYLLGSSVERLVGSARFLCLYFTAAIGGSVASTLLLGTVPSVGASGAIWGLLAAEGVLAYRPQGMFPASFAAQMKKAALTNLAINVAISFRPGVDWGAHLGGGLVGAVLMGSGVLVMGLVKLSQVEGVGTEAVRAPPITPSLPARIGAAILSIVAGGSLVVAIAVGRPWLLDTPLVLERRAIAGSDLLLDLPKDFAREKIVPLEAGMPPGAMYYQLGDLATDPCTVFVYRAPFAPAVRDNEAEAVMLTMMKTLQEDPLPENWAVVTAPERIAIAGRQRGVYTKRRFKEESTFERTLRLREGDLLRIETVASTRFDATCSGLATRIAASADER